MKPICFLFLSVTRINPCLKQSGLEKSSQNDSLYWAMLKIQKPLEGLMQLIPRCQGKDWKWARRWPELPAKSLFSTKGAVRRPMTYAYHQIPAIMAVSTKSFDLLNSIIYWSWWSRWSIDLRSLVAFNGFWLNILPLAFQVLQPICRSPGGHLQTIITLCVAFAPF